MNGYFLTLIIIYVLALGVSLSEHGKPRTGEHNFFNSLFVNVLIILLTYFAIEKDSDEREDGNDKLKETALDLSVLQ